MATEVERKYLVLAPKPANLPKGRQIQQGYLSERGTTVRVRIIDDKAILSIKCHVPGKGHHKSGAIERLEFEYPIPIEDAQTLLECTSIKIEKTRHVLDNGIEVDVFHGALDGFVMAEFESPDGRQAPHTEGLHLIEVTDDSRYSNAWMAENGIPPEMPPDEA